MVAQALAGASLVAGGYMRTLSDAGNADFAYLDPPYPPLNGTSFFSHYTMDRFAAEEQVRLADAAHALSKRGCLVMISNADTSDIRRLYRGFSIHKLSATRYVTCKARKHRVGEVVVTNYD